METITYKNLKFQVWDLGGQTSIRPYWRCYYENTNAVIYVIDSADSPERFATSKQELMTLLQEEELKNAALLVFANKQDLPGAMSEAKISELLNLTSLTRQWAIFKTSAVFQSLLFF